MKTVELDDDVYSFLLSKIENFGESVSDVIRRLLSVSEGASLSSNNKNHNFFELFARPDFIAARTVVERYLLILSEICKQKEDEFRCVLGQKSRTRINFSASKEEIVSAGTSCQPKEIPRTKYWADTNNSTSQKKGLLAQLLRKLGYDANSIKAALNALDK